jgi:hypothetical protein
MMEPLEEAKSLRENPIPVEGDDNLLPTRVAAIDKEIAEIDVKIQDLAKEQSEKRATRVLLIDHAVKTGHMEDPRFKIEVEITYGNRVADAAKLAEKFPKEFSVYVMAMANHGIQKIAGVLEKSKIEPTAAVNLGIADKIFGKKNVDSCSVIPEASRVYKVVKK